VNTVFNNALIKVWFSSGACKNFEHVTSVVRKGDGLTMVTDGNMVILNWNNINFVEEVQRRGD